MGVQFIFNHSKAFSVIKRSWKRLATAQQPTKRSFREFMVKNVNAILAIYFCHIPYLMFSSHSFVALVRDTSLIFWASLLGIVLTQLLCFRSLSLMLKYILCSFLFICYLLDEFMLVNYNYLPDRATVAVLITSKHEGNKEETISFIRDAFRNLTFVRTLIIHIARNYLCGYCLSRVLKALSGIYCLLSVLLGCIVLLSALPNNWSALFIVRYGKLYLGARRELAGYTTILQRLRKHTPVILKNSQKIPYFCLILGEALTRNHMSLYGYKFKTTPMLDELNKKGELIVYKDVVCAYANTIESVKYMFTFLENQDEKMWFDSNNFFSILNQAGYHTVWLSNQEFTGHGLTPTRFFTDICSEHRYTIIRDSTSAYHLARLDGELVDMLKSSLEGLMHKHEPQFHLLHLYGAHSRYSKRYPHSFSIFHESNYRDTNLTQSRRKLRAAYDNAIRYNDYVVSSIIDLYRQKNAIVLFLSDHGEEVFDTIDMNGHNGYQNTRNMLEIPMVFWLSPILKSRLPNLYQRISNCTNCPFMTDNLIHLLLDILGIETPEYRPEFSVISASFQRDRIRRTGQRV